VVTIPALPHSRSSFFFCLDEVVFTGSIVHAGTIGETGSAYAEALLIASVKDYLFHRERETLILPSVGPPSTIGAEQDLSPFYRDV
jgi:hydroxyacylglutathione hydrolase